MVFSEESKEHYFVGQGTCPSVPIARQVVAAAAVLALLSFGFAGVARHPSVLSNIPLIGAALEEYIDSSKPDLKDYKVVIGQTVEDKGIEIIWWAPGRYLPPLIILEVMLRDSNMLIFTN